MQNRSSFTSGAAVLSHPKYESVKAQAMTDKSRGEKWIVFLLFVLWVDIVLYTRLSPKYMEAILLCEAIFLTFKSGRPCLHHFKFWSSDLSLWFLGLVTEISGIARDLFEMEPSSFFKLDTEGVCSVADSKLITIAWKIVRLEKQMNMVGNLFEVQAACQEVCNRRRVEFKRTYQRLLAAGMISDRDAVMIRATGKEGEPGRREFVNRGSNSRGHRHYFEAAERLLQ